jgi:hypothetical protein
MTPIAVIADDVRREAARLAVALLRFEQVATHPPLVQAPEGLLQVGTDAYIFMPSGRRVPRDGIEDFLVSLPSPAVLAPTNRRGMIALLLLHELSGERRAGFQHELDNSAAALDDDIAPQLGLSARSRILVEFDEESHVFSFAAVREWTQQFVVPVGWSMGSLHGEDRAEARLLLRRSDGRRFSGRSDMTGAVRGAA